MYRINRYCKHLLKKKHIHIINPYRTLSALQIKTCYDNANNYIHYRHDADNECHVADAYHHTCDICKKNYPLHCLHTSHDQMICQHCYNKLKIFKSIKIALTFNG